MCYLTGALDYKFEKYLENYRTIMTLFQNLEQEWLSKFATRWGVESSRANAYRGDRSSGTAGTPKEKRNY